MLDIRIEPDFEAFRANILRQGTPQRVHFIELHLDAEVIDAIAQRFDLLDRSVNDSPYPDVAREVAVYRFLGYDMFRVRPFANFAFPREFRDADDTVTGELSRGRRNWTDEHAGPIQSWADFEAYPWPDPQTMDLGVFEWLAKALPEGMACAAASTQVFEQVTWLLGYETLCLKIYDEPDLVDAMFQRVGRINLQLADILCQIDCVKVIFGGDDMGYKTGTMICPQVLIDKSLIWHKRMAEVAHRTGRLYLLHSCGNITDLMPYLIDEVRIDGRHSFEDAIEPVTEAKRKYGDRIAVLGGIDVDFLCRSDESAIRQRVRDTLEVCMPGGGYCLGTGNSVANYIPLDHYLTMLDEGRRYAG